MLNPDLVWEELKSVHAEYDETLVNTAHKQHKYQLSSEPKKVAMIYIMKMNTFPR